MYAVVFRAECVDSSDNEYLAMAKALRQRAQADYGCSEFISVYENGQEVAISYWPSLEAILAWKADPLHQQAQQMGRERWYRRYRIEVVELLRAYNSS